MALIEIGGGLDVYIRIESEEKSEKNGRPGAIDANCTPWHIQTIWADVIGVGEVPPNFMKTSGDRKGAREGEQEWKDGSSHRWWGKRELESREKRRMVPFIYYRSRPGKRVVMGRMNFYLISSNPWESRVIR